MSNIQVKEHNSDISRPVCEKTIRRTFEHNVQYTIAQGYKGKDSGGYLSAKSEESRSYEVFSSFKYPYHGLNVKCSKVASERSLPKTFNTRVAFFCEEPVACSGDFSNKFVKYILFETLRYFYFSLTKLLRDCTFIYLRSDGMGSHPGSAVHVKRPLSKIRTSIV